ncbi:Hybrid signal transduction histidine kinase K [Paramyrothecium foliicola]|nr:Hybrid signal transduction histidine kinase K [Paramyrothecium foliicola]
MLRLGFFLLVIVRLAFGQFCEHQWEGKFADEKIDGIPYLQAKADVAPPPLEIRPLIVTGPSSNRVDLIFLGDGYTEAEKEKFFRDALFLAKNVTDGQTFNDVAPLMNWWAGFSPSAESGVGVGGRPLDTVYGLYRDGTELRGVYYDKPEVARAACQSTDACDYPILLGNDPYYGGLGGSFTVITSSTVNGPAILRHELGHSIINVGEEYDGATGYFGVNSARAPSAVPWTQWYSKPQAEPKIQRSNMPIQAYTWTLLNSTRAWSRTFTSAGTYSSHLVQFSISGVPESSDLRVELDGKDLNWRAFPGIGLDRYIYNLKFDTALAPGQHRITFSLLNKAREGTAQLCSIEVLEYGNGSQFVSQPGYYGLYPTYSETNTTTYRPTNNDCLMRWTYTVDFCAACIEGLWWALLRPLSLIDSITQVARPTAVTNITLDLLDVAQFRKVPRPTEAYTIKWFNAANNSPLAQWTNRTSALINQSIAQVDVEVRLWTAQVKVDKEGLLVQKERIAVQKSGTMATSQFRKRHRLLLLLRQIESLITGASAAGPGPGPASPVMSEARAELHDPIARISPTDCSPAQLGNINILDYLNFDQRLNFVLDFSINSATTNSLVFCNSALLASALHNSVLRLFSHKPTDARSEENAFAKWIFDQVEPNVLGVPTVFYGTLWTVSRLSDSLAVISGVELGHCDLRNCNSFAPKNVQQSSVANSGSLSVCHGDQISTNLTSPAKEIWPPLGFGDSAYISWIREFDWASTSLGPTDTWPRELKQACEMMLANPDPATVFWGHELILIYNEAYLEIAGNKHPAMMGGSARIHWEEVWDQYDPLFDKMFIDGIAFEQNNTQLFIHRKGYLEEGYFNMRVMPIMGGDGSVVGFYEPVTEVTKQTLSERRMHMLLKLSESTSSETTMRGLWKRLLEFLSHHPSDVHFAMLYRLQRQSEPAANTRYTLEGAVGVGIDVQCLQQLLDTCEPGGGSLMATLRRAHESRNQVLLLASDGSLSSSILAELKTAGIAEEPRACIVCPLFSSDDSVEALLVLGTSPNRPHNEEYEVFVNLLVRQIEDTITSVELLKKEKEQLIQQAEYTSNLRFKRFAENAQVGIFSFDPSGNITFCNDSWLELSGHARGDLSAMSWTHDVHPDNAEEIKAYWDKIVNLEGAQTFEVQYKKPWRPANLNDDSISLDRTWVVASAYAEVSEQGELAAVVGCVTDISSFKWVDQLQSQRLSEALELKRQQENFLDITSHEMRNPLNAILHCATELIEMLQDLVGKSSTAECRGVLRDCLDASRTIAYCGRHQKRIIDDVLTLSKLDSNLLSISPVNTRPLDVVEEVLRVFDTEMRASSINTKTELAPSYTAMKIETLLVDPHRLLQILINLVANAIKFTKAEFLRSLHIVIEAHDTEPVKSNNGVRYVPSGRRPVDPTINPDWGTGDIVYLHFSVKDTGPGMSQEEADRLFNRFTQGSPRTHVQYGGSGLGLFISRELAELHGGRIGISTELGHGSTFDFYVKGRRPTGSDVQRSLDNDAVAHLLTDPTAQIRAPSEQFSPELTTQPSPALPDPSQIHVLIVEDNIINQKILAKLIRKQGWVASVTNHGEEALAEISASTWHHNPSVSITDERIKLDIVLADIEMPVMNGKEFVRQVRRLQDEGVLAQDIPVIAVTGNARNEQIKQAEECGFDEVLSKPYRQEDIISIVRRYTKIDTV